MSSRGDRPPRVSLLIRNLPMDMRTEELQAEFDRFGLIRDIYLPRDHYTGRARGFGFVEFTDARDADDALNSMDRKMIMGREIQIEISRQNRRTPKDMVHQDAKNGRYMDGRSSRGRDYSPRGRDRDYSPRGRGPSPRGRGYSPRGRGYSPRGRGYSPRGRSRSRSRGRYNRSPSRDPPRRSRRSDSPPPRKRSPARRSLSASPRRAASPRRDDPSPKRSPVNGAASPGGD